MRYAAIIKNHRNLFWGKQMKHNVYFDGKVQSLSINSKRAPATVGVIEPGKYTFTTSSEERLSVIEGKMMVKLSGEDWKELKSGDKEIVVSKNSSFDVNANEDVAYICFYL
ncbi:MAG: pyrimidine/purine nucleoside phosphorylase [Chlorobiales bacterium]|nr:pyrimidine/purine nucleoside phosphorylase [Chlorobiales bacterium]